MRCVSAASTRSPSRAGRREHRDDSSARRAALISSSAGRDVLEVMRRTGADMHAPSPRSRPHPGFEADRPGVACWRTALTTRLALHTGSAATRRCCPAQHGEPSVTTATRVALMVSRVTSSDSWRFASDTRRPPGCRRMDSRHASSTAPRDSTEIFRPGAAGSACADPVHRDAVHVSDGGHDLLARAHVRGRAGDVDGDAVPGGPRGGPRPGGGGAPFFRPVTSPPAAPRGGDLADTWARRGRRAGRDRYEALGRKRTRTGRVGASSPDIVTSAPSALRGVRRGLAASDQRRARAIIGQAVVHFESSSARREALTELLLRNCFGWAIDATTQQSLRSSDARAHHPTGPDSRRIAGPRCPLLKTPPGGPRDVHVECRLSRRAGERPRASAATRVVGPDKVTDRDRDRQFTIRRPPHRLTKRVIGGSGREQICLLPVLEPRSTTSVSDGASEVDRADAQVIGPGAGRRHVLDSPAHRVCAALCWPTERTRSPRRRGPEMIRARP